VLRVSHSCKVVAICRPFLADSVCDARKHTFDYEGRSDVEKESLQLLLDQGESVERIAKRFGKDPSTVSYGMNKYGLTSSHAEKHAARGRIERERLEGLVNDGLSIAEIVAELGRSKATVRHWLRRYELKTRGGRRHVARQAGLVTVELVCRRHGRTPFPSRPVAAIDASGAEPKASLGIAGN
jgi:transposase